MNNFATRSQSQLLYTFYEYARRLGRGNVLAFDPQVGILGSIANFRNKQTAADFDY
jgi:hypothetical protein